MRSLKTLHHHRIHRWHSPACVTSTFHISIYSHGPRCISLTWRYPTYLATMRFFKSQHFSPVFLVRSNHPDKCDRYNTLFVQGQCPLQEGALPTVLNSHRSNVDNVKLSSEGTAFGYYDIECDPGFTLDPTIGGRISCFETGQWSNPLPQCVSTSKASARCPYTDEMLKFANGHISTAKGFLLYDDHTAEGKLVRE